MKVLVTGATGLVGKELVSSLLKDAFEVNYLTSSKSKIQQKENYKGFYWNPKKGEIDKTAFNGVSTIINLAGASIAQTWNSKNKKSILNLQTKELTTVPLTSEEENERIENQKLEDARETELQNIKTNKASGKQKLKDLGLNDAEIKALIGV